MRQKAQSSFVKALHSFESGQIDVALQSALDSAEQFNVFTRKEKGNLIAIDLLLREIYICRSRPDLALQAQARVLRGVISQRESFSLLVEQFTLYAELLEATGDVMAAMGVLSRQFLKDRTEAAGTSSKSRIYMKSVLARLLFEAGNHKDSMIFALEALREAQAIHAYKPQPSGPAYLVMAKNFAELGTEGAHRYLGLACEAFVRTLNDWESTAYPEVSLERIIRGRENLVGILSVVKVFLTSDFGMTKEVRNLLSLLFEKESTFLKFHPAGEVYMEMLRGLKLERSRKLRSAKCSYQAAVDLARTLPEWEDCQGIAYARLASISQKCDSDDAAKRNWDHAESYFRRRDLWDRNLGEQLLYREMMKAAQMRGDEKWASHAIKAFLGAEERILLVSGKIVNQDEILWLCRKLWLSVEYILKLSREHFKNSVEIQGLAAGAVMARKAMLEILDIDSSVSGIAKSEIGGGRSLGASEEDIEEVSKILDCYIEGSSPTLAHKRRIQAVQNSLYFRRRNISRLSEFADQALGRIKQVLREGEVLLEFGSYSMSDFADSENDEANVKCDRYVIFIMDRGGLREVLDISSEALNGRGPGATPEEWSEWTESPAGLFELYKGVGEKIGSALRPQGDSILYVAPIGVLVGIKLGALPVSVRNNMMQRLAEKFEISILASGRELVAKRKRAVLSFRSHGRDDLRVGVLSKCDDHSIDWEEEVRMIEDQIGKVSVLRWDQVSGISEVNHWIKGIDVLHFAGHGGFRKADAFSWLGYGAQLRLLTISSLGGDSDFIMQEGVTGLHWSSCDLRNLRFAVFLSCFGANVQYVPGAGAYGLRRALMVAGCRSGVLAIDKLSNEVTSDFVSAFYKGIAQKESPIRAVQQWQREAIGKGVPAREWAAICAFGVA